MGINRFSYLELSLKSGLESFAQEKYFSWSPYSFSFSSVSVLPGKLLFYLFSFFFVSRFVLLDFLCPLSWPISSTDCICWGLCAFQISASIHWLLGDHSLWKLSKTGALLHFRCCVFRHGPHSAHRSCWVFGPICSFGFLPTSWVVLGESPSSASCQ